MPGEFEGKTVAQAVDNACQALGIDPSRLTYEVIRQGASGFFGLIGTRKALIRVSLPETAAGTGENAQTDTAATVSPDLGPRGRTDQPVAFDPGVEAARRLGTEALQRLVDAITDGALVEARGKNGRLHFSITGGNPGLLIGKHGQTLEAIQYLADKIINRGSHDRVRIHVDVSGYLEKRGQRLTQMALRMAANAKHSSKPLALEPMSAYERRLIHMALKNDGAVRTQSVGDGGDRKLIIYPSGVSTKTRRPAGAGTTPADAPSSRRKPKKGRMQ